MDIEDPSRPDDHDPPGAASRAGTPAAEKAEGARTAHRAPRAEAAGGAGLAVTPAAPDAASATDAADTTEGATAVEVRLREALAPPPAAVERVVRGALAARSGTGERLRGSPRLDRRRPLLAAMAPALAMALLLGAGLWLGSGRHGYAPGDLRREAAVSITNVGDIVVARSGGRTRIVRSATPGAAPPAGELFIRYGGGE